MDFRLKAWIVVAVFLWAGVVFSSPYHSFKNTQGKIIRAQIIQYDAQNERVRLRLKNGKKAWVDLSVLSESDQEFIKHWKKGKSPRGSFLPEERVRAIAQKYIESLGTGVESQKIWKQLFKRRYAKDPLYKDYSEGHPFVGHPEKIKILQVEGLNVKIQFEDQTGWLQLLPDGTIKYDPLFFPHPLVGLTRYMETLMEPTRCTRLRGYLTPFLRRKQLGASCFDFDSSPDINRETLMKQFYDWFVATGGDWDSSEPKLRLPEEWFEELSEELKKYAYPESMIQPSPAYEEYLAKWKKENEKQSERVSKEEKRDIAALYIQAMNNLDIDLLYPLFCPSQRKEVVWKILRVRQENNRPEAIFSPECGVFVEIWAPNQARMSVKKLVAPGEITGNEVKILVDGRCYPRLGGDTYEKKNVFGGWILLTPEGDIKYDSFAFFPTKLKVYQVLEIMKSISHEDRLDELFYYQVNLARALKEWNIPLCGFDASATRSKQEKAIGKIGEWLENQGSEWDSSEPKVTIPLDSSYDGYRVHCAIGNIRF